VTNLAGTLQESWSPNPASATPGALVKSTTATGDGDGDGDRRFVRDPFWEMVTEMVTDDLSEIHFACAHGIA